MNVKVRNKEIDGVVGKWGEDGVNENRQYLVDVYADYFFFSLQTPTSSTS